MVFENEAGYTLQELADEVCRRLAAADVAPASGRVSPRPDGRTLRYYTTTGLLDRPLEVRDRQARYGERHVLQVLAIKSLQAAGQSLATIQAALAGLADADLADVAAAARGHRQPFWAAPAVPSAPAAGRGRPPRTGAGPSRNQTVLPLVPGVSLTLDGVWGPQHLAAAARLLGPLTAQLGALAAQANEEHA